MAEGLEVELPIASQKYFCHLCIQEVSPIYPDLTCPLCLSGFVEEVAHNSDDSISDESDPDNDLDSAPPLIEVSLDDLIRRTIRRTILDFERRENLVSPTFQQWLRNSGSRQSLPGMPSVSDESNILPMFGELDADEDGPGNFHQFFQLTSNLGDYAFGVEWDAIITQFLNEAEVTGPPPLPKDQIEAIPGILIRKEHVEKDFQCTVCMDDFKLNEEVKNLPCDHFFHKECIFPWLERHATCPICRKLINTAESHKDKSSEIPPPRETRGSGSDNSARSSSQSSSSTSSVDLGIDFDSLNIHPHFNL